ncbi:MAG: sulfatase-like hydrolase/transferase [Promethearchaeota archaeon]|nr:MAG: sulfatase-like hydrolase/transferase [Candidatus Lokiarchaeota archaeon]
MSERKNVLFIITDQHRVDHLGFYGNPIVKTPNIDKLASESIVFTNSFTVCPMCMPNRATLLTGYYPNVHGVRSNGINLPSNVPTITQTLKNRGYHTILIGKAHFNFNTPPHNPKMKSAESFDDWKVKNPKGNHLTHKNFPMPYYGFEEVKLVLGHGPLCLGHYYDWLEQKAPDLAKRVIEEYQTSIPIFYVDYESFIPEELYSTRYIQNQTVSFLERYSKGEYNKKPFFLQCSFPDPHQPVGPPERYRDMYNIDEINLPENFDDMPNLYKHPYLKTHMENPPIRGAMLREETEENVKKFIALTYGSITMIDDAVGQILTTLEKLGLADNTMVIFTSDHGDFMGEHGMILKGPAPFNGPLQVPLIWKVPRLTKPSISDSLISSVDLPKTILELLNIKERYRPIGMQGYDMTPVLKDPSKKIRDCILIVEDEEVGPKGPLYTRVCHLITEDYKLTKYQEVPEFGDIFDRKKDVKELNNLWDKDKDLKLNLLDKLIHEYLTTRSRFPIRQGGT